MAIKDYKKVIKENIKNKVVKPYQKKATQILDDLDGTAYRKRTMEKYGPMIDKKTGVINYKNK